MQQDGTGFGLIKVLLKIWLTVIKVITSLLPTKRAIVTWLFLILFPFRFSAPHFFFIVRYIIAFVIEFFVLTAVQIVSNLRPLLISGVPVLIFHNNNFAESVRKMYQKR